MLFATLPGATVTSDGTTLPVAASAEFTLAGSQLTLQIFNNIADPTSVLQNISSINFDVYTNMGIYTADASITGLSGHSVSIGDRGGYTTSSVDSLPAHSWTITFEGGTTNAFHLSALGTGQPQYTVIGSPDGNSYHPNGSLQTGSHNPFLQSGAQFTISFPGAVLTNVDHVVFAFGTAPGITSNAGEAPEPAMLGTVGLGLLAIGYAVAQSRRRPRP